MSIVNNPLYPPRNLPGGIPAIVPFSMRETPSLLLMVEEMRKWMNDSLVPFINENIEKLSADWVSAVTELTENWERLSIELIAQVESAKTDAEAAAAASALAQSAAEAARDLAALYASQAEEIQDTAITGIVTQVDSSTRELLDLLYAGKSDFEVISEAVENGRLSEDTLSGRFDEKLDKSDFTDFESARVPSDQKRYVTVNVRDFGAVEYENSDTVGSTEKIQAAINFVHNSGGGTVIIDGVYWVKAHDENTSSTNYLRDSGGIEMLDNVTLKLTGSAQLKAISNSYGAYNIIRIYDKTNVEIEGGSLIGDAASHTGVSGEWGYGIAISGSTDVRVKNVNVRDCWGDGINVQVVASGGVYVPSKNVKITSVVCDNNRRQGMSIEGLVGGIIEDSTFKNTGRTTFTAPGAGIDIEPWNDSNPVTDLTIRNCNFINNVGNGLLIFRQGCKNISVDDCVFDGNSGQYQLRLDKTGGSISVKDCVFSNSPVNVPQLSGAVLVLRSSNVKFDANTFDARLILWIHSDLSLFENVRIINNDFRFNHSQPIECIRVTEHARKVEISGNLFQHSGARAPGVVVNVGSSGTLQDVAIHNNTFTNCSNAIITGIVTNLTIDLNVIDSSGASAISTYMKSGHITRNRISGACLTSDTAQMVVLNSDYVMIEGNTFLREPIMTVPETRRATHAIRFGFSEVNGLWVRNNLIKDLVRYDQLPALPRTNSYAETTPGNWAW